MTSLPIQNKDITKQTFSDIAIFLPIAETCKDASSQGCPINPGVCQ